MGESHHQGTTSSRLGMRSTVGEIVEVQGGHIVRSTGRKDRHSKVCTAKGPRDRRVRLSAHTAIQFYDVQDRLGYDRPSKAVDWLIKKAKAAIDELEELPAWNPTTAAATATTTRSNQPQEDQTGNERECQFSMENLAAAAAAAAAASVATAACGSGSISNTRKIQTTKATKTAPTTTKAVASNVPSMHNSSSSFLPASLDSDAIADTIRTFFPMGASADHPTSLSLQFQSYPPDLLSRTSSQTQDLRLSLQSFPEPILLPHAHHPRGEQQVLFSETAAAQNPLGFDGSSAGWSEHHHHHHQGEESRFQRMVAWNADGTAADAQTGGNGGGGDAGGGPGGGFMFNPQPQPPLLQPLFGQTQFFSQRGPLQSSNTPSIRAWIDPAITAAHHHHHHFHEIPQINQDQSGISGIGFSVSGGGGGGYSGFSLPARIQGEEEEHVGIPNRPSSTSSDSRH